MASVLEQRRFNHNDLLTALIKQADLHEGYWMIGFEFGMGATNMLNEKDGIAAPAAIVSVLGAMLTRVEELSPLAIDASSVNPK